MRTILLARLLIYICASLLLCMTLVQSIVLRWALLVCPLYNPFVLDYLVARDPAC